MLCRTLCGWSRLFFSEFNLPTSNAPLRINRTPKGQQGHGRPGYEFEYTLGPKAVYEMRRRAPARQPGGAGTGAAAGVGELGQQREQGSGFGFAIGVGSEKG